MHKLPKYIFVVSIIRYTDNTELVDVLKDYFSGVPYIDITDYESNRQTVQYIVHESRIIKKKVTYKIYSMKDKFKILDYAYFIINDTSTVYHRVYSYDVYSMPDKISVDSIITKLQLWNAV